MWKTGRHPALAATQAAMLIIASFFFSGPLQGEELSPRPTDRVVIGELFCEDD